MAKKKKNIEPVSETENLDDILPWYEDDDPEALDILPWNEDCDPEDFDLPPLDDDSEDLDTFPWDDDPDDFDLEEDMFDLDDDDHYDKSGSGAVSREKKEIPFYDERYTPYAGHVNKEAAAEVDLSNPLTIYEFLRKRVYKQDDYCKNAAMILYDHARGITSANMVCGPSGNGKTYVWECLKEIYPKIIIVNAANLSKDGWKGDNKVTGFASLVDLQEQDYIIVFDEFDKCAAPQFSSGGDNVSASLQSEFLKLIEGTLIPAKHEGAAETKLNTALMTFVLCGSFAVKAAEIADRRSSNGFGFETKRAEVKPFSRELTINDVMDFGVIPELASRIRRLINVHPLTMKDYCYLLTEHEASPVKLMEKRYNIKLNLSKKKCQDIARTAYESGLGVRNATAQLQCIIDDRIFSGFMEKEVAADVL